MCGAAVGLSGWHERGTGAIKRLCEDAGETRTSVASNSGCVERAVTLYGNQSDPLVARPDVAVAVCVTRTWKGVTKSFKTPS